MLTSDIAAHPFSGVSTMQVRLLAIGLAFGVMSSGLALAQAPAGSYAWQQGYNQRLGIVNDQGSYYRYYNPRGNVGWHAYRGDQTVRNQFNSYVDRYNVRQLWTPPTVTPMPLPPSPPSSGFRGIFPDASSFPTGLLYYNENAPRRQ
jgi:hypothetical protein